AESDPIARGIIDQGCAHLAQMVAVTMHDLDLPEDVLVIPVGAVANASQLYRASLEQAILKVLPKVRIRAPLVPAVVGAAFLALQQIGITLPEEVLVTLRDAV